MAALRRIEEIIDGAEDQLDARAKDRKDAYGDGADDGQDQGVLDQSLASFAAQDGAKTEQKGLEQGAHI